MPPAVSWLVVVLGGLAGGVAAFWAWDSDGGWRYAAALVGPWVAMSWWREACSTPVRCLRWDGLAWHLGAAADDGDHVEGDVSIAIDLGSRLLLRFHPARRRGVVWLPLQRRHASGDWHGLRCALYAPRVMAEPAASGVLDA